MNCNADYCIHNKNLVCRYESISINNYGMCEECMIISIDEKELMKMKEKQLVDFIERMA